MFVYKLVLYSQIYAVFILFLVKCFLEFIYAYLNLYFAAKTAQLKDSLIDKQK